MSFTPSQTVTGTFPGSKIVVVHNPLLPVPPVILPFDPTVGITGILPVITGPHPVMVYGGAGNQIVLVGHDPNGNLYDLSQNAWMSPPVVATWLDGPQPIPNNPIPLDRNLILVVAGFTTDPNAPGKAIGMSFTETPPAVLDPSAKGLPAHHIQVSCNVIMNKLAANGSLIGWPFNDFIDLLVAGSTIPPAPATYDVDLVVNETIITRLINIPEANLS